MLKRLTALFILTTFFLTAILPIQMISAQNVLSAINLPAVGSRLSLTAAFNPATIKGLTIHQEDPFLFNFIVHPGDNNLQGEAFRDESTKLIKYFMAALTVSEDQMWVNLSPYEKDRIIPVGFGDTEMGRDLLAQDYMLKQLTASLMYPEDKMGSDFWQRVYQRAQEEYGTTDIPMNTFNKVWIVPNKASVYVNENNVFVMDSHMKVMLEEDYLALETNSGSAKHGVGKIDIENQTKISPISAELIREIIIPELEREVNEGKTFANLRQITNAVILATWYKTNVKGSVLENIYINQNKTKGVDTKDKEINQKIYTQYVEAFKKGVYDFIKEDYDVTTQQVVVRKYFSGGASLNYDTISIVDSNDGFDLEKELRGSSNILTRLGDNPIVSSLKGIFNQQQRKINELSKVYKEIFEKDIRFPGLELEKLLMPLYKNKLVDRKLGNWSASEHYLNKAYTAAGVWDADSDSGELWEAVVKDVKKKGYTTRVITNDWKTAGVDIFKTWVDLAGLNDEEFSLLKARLERMSSQWTKRQYFMKSMQRDVSLGEMLDYEREIGRLLIERDYIPPVSAVASQVDISMKKRLDRDSEVIPFAQKVDDWAASNSAQYELSAHRVPDMSILLNIMLSVSKGQVDFNKLNKASFLREFNYGNFIIAFLKDKSKKGNALKRFFIVPDIDMREKLVIALWKAVELKLLSEEDIHSFLGIYSYNEFLEYLDYASLFRTRGEIFNETVHLNEEKTKYGSEDQLSLLKELYFDKTSAVIGKALDLLVQRNILSYQLNSEDNQRISKKFVEAYLLETVRNAIYAIGEQFDSKIWLGKINIKVVVFEDRFSLQIIDNGTGFDSQKLKKNELGTIKQYSEKIKFSSAGIKSSGGDGVGLLWLKTAFEEQGFKVSYQNRDDGKRGAMVIVDIPKTLPTHRPELYPALKHLFMPIDSNASEGSGSSSAINPEMERLIQEGYENGEEYVKKGFSKIVKKFPFFFKEGKDGSYVFSLEDGYYEQIEEVQIAESSEDFGEAAFKVSLHVSLKSLSDYRFFKYFLELKGSFWLFYFSYKFSNLELFKSLSDELLNLANLKLLNPSLEVLVVFKNKQLKDVYVQASNNQEVYIRIDSQINDPEILALRKYFSSRSIEKFRNVSQIQRQHLVPKSLRVFRTLGFSQKKITQIFKSGGPILSYLFVDPTIRMFILSSDIVNLPFAEDKSEGVMGFFEPFTGAIFEKWMKNEAVDDLADDIEIIAHEQTHKIFHKRWFKINKEKRIEIISDLKKRHEEYFKNITQIEDYSSRLNSDYKKVNELLARFVGLTARGVARLKMVNIETNEVFIDEPITKEDIALLKSPELNLLPADFENNSSNPTNEVFNSTIDLSGERTKDDFRYVDELRKIKHLKDESKYQDRTLIYIGRTKAELKKGLDQLLSRGIIFNNDDNSFENKSTHELLLKNLEHVIFNSIDAIDKQFKSNIEHGKINIKILFFENQLSIQIIDNGTGFDLVKLEANRLERGWPKSEKEEILNEVGYRFLGGDGLALSWMIEDFEHEGWNVLFQKRTDGERGAVVTVEIPLNPQASSPGGIDLNPKNINMQTQGQKIKMQFPSNIDIDQWNNTNGFVPIILKISPVTNIPLLLGKEQKFEAEELLSLAN